MKIQELFPDVLNENTKYEFKAVLNPDEPLKWAKVIVAYANGEGGTIFVGVNNNRDVFGITLDEIDTTKNLVSIVNDRHIFPHVKFKYSLTSVDDNAERFVLAIRVSPSDSVVRYRDGDFNEKVYVKGDANSIPASPEDIISLSKRKYGVDNAITEIKYDPEEWQSYNQLCRIFREDGEEPTLKELQSEEIITENEFVKSGFLMFKDDYDGDDTLIHCRLWKGKNKTGIVLDRAKYKGNLASVFLSAFTFIERNTKLGWKKTANGGRMELPSYPRIAFREALVNAIAHRDYSIYGTQIDIDIYDDRIDIVSPGSWLLPKKYDEYSIGSIPSIRRNTIIASCLDVANLMERGGTGFATMVESYKDCPEDKQPVVMIHPGFLDIRLFDKQYADIPLVDEDMSDEEKVIHLLESNPMPTKQLQESLHYTSRSRFLNAVINPLIEQGIIYRDGNPKSTKSVFKLKQNRTPQQ